MDRYKNIDCPICEKTLEGTDVVVCPECGAPYHRECYLQEEICIFPELHEKHEDWKPPVRESDTMSQNIDGNASLRCPRCGTVNPPNGIFCQVCGTPLNSTAETAQGTPLQAPGYSNSQSNAGKGPFGGVNGARPAEMPLNPFSNPFGTVAPDEEIDGVAAKDIAIFVGRNTEYYLPRFKEISTKKIRILNWASFLFTGGHFIYRKMYLLGIFVIVINTLLSIPNAVILYNTLSSVNNMAFMGGASASSEALLNINFVCSLLSTALRFVCALFGNTFYKNHVVKAIKSIKAKTPDNDKYLEVLSKKGSVAIKLVTGLLIGYGALYLFSLISVMLMGV